MEKKETINITNTLKKLQKNMDWYINDDKGFLNYDRYVKSIWFYFNEKNNLCLAETFKNTTLKDFEEFISHCNEVVNSSNIEQKQILDLLLSRTTIKKFDKIYDILDVESQNKFDKVITKYQYQKILYTYYVNKYDCPRMMVNSSMNTRRRNN